MASVAQPFDVDMDHDALKGMSLDNLFQFDGAEDLSMGGGGPVAVPQQDAVPHRAHQQQHHHHPVHPVHPNNQRQHDLDMGMSDGPDFFHNSNFLANLELPGQGEYATGALDAMLALDNDADALIMPNYVQAGMASLHSLSAEPSGKPAPKPKRKYTKRKSEDNMTATGAPKKRTLSKHNSSPAPGSVSKTKGLGNKHSSTPMHLDTLFKRDVVVQPKASGLAAVSAKPTSTANSSSENPAKQTSTFRGVSCCGKDRKWQARIRDANRVRYLGRYGTEVEAAFVYDEAARSLKGERAPTNFVKLDDAQKAQLVSAFVANKCLIPDNMMHLVVRTKAKVRKAQAAPAALPFQDTDSFPDSPVAKIKNAANAPAISPTMKSSSGRSFSSPPVPTRLPLDKSAVASQPNLTPIPVSVLFHQENV